MQKKLILLAFVFTCGTYFQARAQYKNVLKLNLISAVIQNTSISYERAISPRISLGGGVGFIINNETSLLGIFLPKTTDEAILAAGKVRLNGFNITADMKWYPLKSQHTAPFGFYINPFLRYFNFLVSGDLALKEITGTDSGVRLDVRVQGFGIGAMIGNNVALSKRFTIDIALGFGQAFGGNKMLVDAQALSEEDYNKLLDWLNETLSQSALSGFFEEVPAFEVDDFSAGTSSISAKKYPMIRAVLGIGYAF